MSASGKTDWQRLSQPRQSQSQPQESRTGTSRPMSGCAKYAMERRQRSKKNPDQIGQEAINKGIALANRYRDRQQTQVLHSTHHVDVDEKQVEPNRQITVCNPRRSHSVDTALAGFASTSARRPSSNNNGSRLNDYLVNEVELFRATT